MGSSAHLGARRAWVAPAALAFALVAPALARAQTIGVAATVRNEVNQVKANQPSPIGSGDQVFRNEVVRTGADSATKLVFSDNTNLAVGPTSTVTLDKFVFAGETNYQKVTVNLVRGAFRFSTGGSEKKAYEINTPVATIGVRGTELDIFSFRGETIVTLLEGRAIVCTRGGQCLIISNPGQTVIVTASNVRATTPNGGPGQFSFASFCGSDGLCGISQFASLPSSGGGGSVAALCGR
jgi:hypothetical protein